ncbi:hypothetical protein TcasGA2_TC034573 [Tribolium castaneum]|uniref:Uncharacterized protein n=1 Tax=Tribolium castaneum TaxID=7070 RepID=A0A139WLZ3_TRICA|nr:hypothetical protein TcasGA2_TC034573 [Tribolium castaneum]
MFDQKQNPKKYRGNRNKQYSTLCTFEEKNKFLMTKRSVHLGSTPND